MKPAPAFYSSPLSRYCADRLPGDFHYCDGDEVLFRRSALPFVYARESGILRILESKRPGEDLTRSQREMFPLLAAALRLAGRAGLISGASGVYVIEGAPPWETCVPITRIRAAAHRQDWLAIGAQADGTFLLTPAQMDGFLRCRLELKGGCR